MRLSARNMLKGKVTDVREGMVMATVKVDVGNGNILTSIITTEAVKEIGVKVGEEIHVMIKATSVMLAK